MKDLWAACIALAAIVGIAGDRMGYGLGAIDLCLVLLVLGFVLYLARGAPAAQR